MCLLIDVKVLSLKSFWKCQSFIIDITESKDFDQQQKNKFKNIETYNCADKENIDVYKGIKYNFTFFLF